MFDTEGILTLFLVKCRASKEANDENKTQARSLIKDFHSTHCRQKPTVLRFAIGPKGDQGSKGDKGQDGMSGVKYVRWGRTTCPSGAEIVYKGRCRQMWRFAGFSIMGESKR